VELDPARLAAVAVVADVGALSAVARMNGALHVGGNVARIAAGARPGSAGLAGGRELALLEVRNAYVEGKLKHLLELARRHLDHHESLEMFQLLTGRVGHEELEPLLTRGPG